MQSDELKSAKAKYTNHKSKCSPKRKDRRVGKDGKLIEFNLSFEEWLAVWTASGRLAQSGSRRGHYVMSRYGDVGHYEVGNVFIQLHEDNISERQKGRVKSAEEKAKRKANGITYQQVTCPHCGTVGGSNVMRMWHFGNCKNLTTERT